MKNFLKTNFILVQVILVASMIINFYFYCQTEDMYYDFWASISAIGYVVNDNIDYEK